MSSSYQIRLYERGDREQVTELWEKVFAYPTAHNRPDKSIDRKMDFQPELFFVAVDSAVVIGTVMGGYDGHRGWIYSLAVAEPARRFGVGRALMQHVEHALSELGCPKINLQVLVENEAVVAFYEDLGYDVEPRISMGKVLAPPGLKP